MTTLTTLFLGVTEDEARELLVRHRIPRSLLGPARKDARFEAQHPRYPKGHPRAGRFMAKPDLEAFQKLKPIRDLIGNMPTGRHRNIGPINHALDAIDKVIRFPATQGSDKLTIVSEGRRSESGTAANYDFRSKRVNLFDVRVPSDEDGFSVRRFAEGEGPSSTVAHEIAHWLDNDVLPAPLGVKEEHAAHDERFFASGVQLGMEKAANAADGERTPSQEALLEWGYRVFTSPPYTHLTSLRGRPISVTINGNRRDLVVPDGLIDYLTNAPELWARSFEQYLAYKTSDREMLSYVVEHRRKTDAAPVRLPNYWTAEEFAPIQAAFDRLFATLGWAVPEVKP